MIGSQMIGSQSVLLRCFIGLALLAFVGCSSPPRVTSPEAMELIKQAYTACNTKNGARLEATRGEYQKLVDEGKFTESEQLVFQEILDLAQQGKWEDAQDLAFQFAEAQVR